MAEVTVYAADSSECFGAGLLGSGGDLWWVCSLRQRSAALMIVDSSGDVCRAGYRVTVDSAVELNDCGL